MPDAKDEGNGDVNMVLCWSVFASTVAILTAFDVYVINKGSKIVEVPPRQAALYCLMWLICGIMFNVVVYLLYHYDTEAAFGWFNGYILEYMLSMDNVFFFQVVFKYYRTPKSQVNRALLYGIGMAAALRLLFFFLGTAFFQLLSFTRYIFGLILIWSGYKTAMDSGEEESNDPSNSCTQCIASRLRIYNSYSSDGEFFIKVPRDMAGPPQDCERSELIYDTESTSTSASSNPQVVAAAGGVSNCQGPVVYKATLLLMVVIVLGVVDVLFAVDSVTAKISQYDDMFINFSSSIFAMLTLRSLYFLVVYLADLFVLMKYGIALILVLVGLQLLLGSYVEISNRQSSSVLIIVFFTSILASVVYSKCISTWSRSSSVVELEVIGSRHMEPSDVELGEYEPQPRPKSPFNSEGSLRGSPLDWKPGTVLFMHYGPPLSEHTDQADIARVFKDPIGSEDSTAPEVPEDLRPVGDASPTVSVVNQRLKRMRIGDDEPTGSSESSSGIDDEELSDDQRRITVGGDRQRKRRCTDVSSDKSSDGSCCCEDQSMSGLSPERSHSPTKRNNSEAYRQRKLQLEELLKDQMSRYLAEYRSLSQATKIESRSSPTLRASDVNPTFIEMRKPTGHTRDLPTIVPKHLEDKIGAYALAKHWPSMFLPRRDAERPEKFPLPFHPRVGFF